MTLPQIALPTAPHGGQTMTTQVVKRLILAPGPLLWNNCDFWGVLNPNCASNFNQSYPDDCAEMGLEFWHVIRVLSSSGFYFLSTDVCEPWLVKWDQRERMTESQRYLSWSREASPVGPSGQGLPYGPSGAQLEGGREFITNGKLKPLSCPTNKLHWSINNISRLLLDKSQKYFCFSSTI